MWRLLGYYLLEYSFSLFQFSVLLEILLDLNVSITSFKCLFLFFLSISQCHILGIFSEFVIGLSFFKHPSVLILFYPLLFMKYHSLKKISLISWFPSVSRYPYFIFFSFHQSELICWLICWQSFLTFVISVCFFIGFAASSCGEVIFPVFLCAHHPPLLPTSSSLLCQLRPLFPWSHWQYCRSMQFLGEQVDPA